jgi:hypothetical protein
MWYTQEHIEKKLSYPETYFFSFKTKP